MNESRVEATFADVAGKVQDAVGGLTGDTITQVKGKVRQAAGQAQDAAGRGADQIRRGATSIAKGAKQQPLVAVLVAAMLGYVLGLLAFRR